LRNSNPMRQPHAQLTGLDALSSKLDDLAGRLDSLTAAGPGSSPATTSPQAAAGPTRSTESVLRALDRLDQRIREATTHPATLTPRQPASQPRRSAAGDAELDRSVREIASRQSSLDRDDPAPVPAPPIPPVPPRRPTPPTPPQMPPQASAAPSHQGMAAMEARLDDHFKTLMARLDATRYAGGENAEMRNLRNDITALREAISNQPATAANSRSAEDIRAEIAELRETMLQENIGGALHSLENAYHHIVERMDGLSRIVGDPQVLQGINATLSEIRHGLDGLPSQDHFDRIDGRVTALANRIDQLAAQRPEIDLSSFEAEIRTVREAIGALDVGPTLIELDRKTHTISKKVDAIVAYLDQQNQASGNDELLAAVAGQADGLKRLEGQMQELREAVAKTDLEPWQALDGRLNEISLRLDTLAAPELTQALAAILERLDSLQTSGGGSAEDFAGLHREIAGLRQEIADAGQPGHDLHARLAETIERLETATRQPQDSGLDSRLDEISARLDGLAAPETGEALAAIAERLEALHAAGVPAPELEAVHREIAQLRQEIVASGQPDQDLTARLAGLVERMESAAPVNEAETLAGLEAQIDALTRSLGSQNPPDLGHLETQLNLIATQISQSGSQAAEAARSAAHEAVSEFAGQAHAEIAALRETTAHNEARTSGGIEALHGTLQSIVARLEQTRPEPAAPAERPPRPARTTAEQTAAEPADRHPEAQAAQFLEAALSPQDDAETGRQASARPSSERIEDHFHLEGANEPLEPGSRRPADMTRTPRPAGHHEAGHHEAGHGETRRGETGEASTSQADFIAAARRAAQAAAAQAQGDESEEDTGKKTSWLKARLTRKRKKDTDAEEHGKESHESERHEPELDPRHAETVEPAPAGDMGIIPERHDAPLPGDPENEVKSGGLRKSLMVMAAVVVLALGSWQAYRIFLAPKTPAPAKAPVAATTKTPASSGAATASGAPASGEKRMDSGAAGGASRDVMSESGSMAGGGKPMAGGGKPMAGGGKPMAGGGKPMAGGAGPEGADTAATTSKPAAITGPGGSDVAFAPPGAAGAGGTAKTPDTGPMASGSETDATTKTARAPATGTETETGADSDRGMDGGTTSEVAMPPEAIGSIKLRMAAAKGNPAAQFEVAARFTDGRKVPQNLTQSALWYSRAAERGLAPAQYRLGSMYEKGKGVDKDLKMAQRLYEVAAKAGNAKAMHNLAVLYAEGAMGEPDFASAAKWFTMAADRGVRDSQYNAGILYTRGLGVRRDLATAYKWFAIAAKEGDRDAGSKRDEIANALDRSTLATARLAVETWHRIKVPAEANIVAPPEGGWGDDDGSSASRSGGAAKEKSAMATKAETATGSTMSAEDRVARAQTLLTGLGYDPGPADGKMGPKTRSAIVAFQRKEGLAETGRVDKALLERLASPSI